MRFKFFIIFHFLIKIYRCFSDTQLRMLEGFNYKSHKIKEIIIKTCFLEIHILNIFLYILL